MEIPIKYRPLYPWMDMNIGDHFTPSRNVAKLTMLKLTVIANRKYAPMRFSTRTTKGRWEIRRVL